MKRFNGVKLSHLISQLLLLIQLAIVIVQGNGIVQDNATLDWFSAKARLNEFKTRRNPTLGTKDNDGEEEHGSSPRMPFQFANSLILGKTFFTKQQLEDTSNYFLQDENFSNQTMKTFAYMGTNVKLLTQAWTDLFLHQFDSYKIMKQAAGSNVDQELCLSHLEELEERTRLNLEVGLESRDMNYLRYIDTFGRVPAGLFLGNTFWIGSYDECQRLRIHLAEGNSSTKARYCVASFRFKDWSKKDPLGDVLVFKLGVCLPEACDSTYNKRKLQLITRLIEYNARQSDLDTIDLKSLYCLPDEESELRAWWRFGPTLVTVIGAGLWMFVLLFATYKDELQRKRARQKTALTMDAFRSAGKIGLSNGFKTTASSSSLTFERIYTSLSITSNLRSLFSTEKSSLLEVATASSSDKKTAMNDALKRHEQDSNEEIIPRQSKSLLIDKIVDLDVIEGVKVLAAIYIISGHVLMVASQVTNNGREMATSRSVVYAISNLMPAFAVNAFFAITGILTSYLIFKQNQSHSFITSPIKWIAFILYRYLRIMPTYALVTLFCKHIARFIGDGPLWDYGTSSLALRRTCEQEPWAWTLLFGANFKNPLKHCIAAAWYLANDFQFFIVTPIFLAVLHKRPNFGKALIMGSVLAGYLAGIWSVLMSEAPDLRPIANFMPHGFMVYVNFLLESYTRPQYRIPAYLIGLLMGHMLFEYEQRRTVYLKQMESGDGVSDGDQEQGNWGSWMSKYAHWFSMSVVAGIILIPSLGSRLPVDQTSARWLVAFFMPTLHVLYALAVGMYVLMSTTGHGSATMDWLLSRHFWKPLSRLSLCVVLVNVEVIAYIIQSSRDTKFMNNQYLATLNLYALVWTYIVATIVCILFEAPVRAALNQLLAFAVRQVVSKAKKMQ